MSALTDALARLHRDMGSIDGETLRYQHGPSARTTVEPLEAAIIAAEEEREALLGGTLLEMSPRVVAAFISPQNGDWQGSSVNVMDDGSWWAWCWQPAPPDAPGDAPLWSGYWMELRPPIARARGAAEAHHGR